MAKKFYAVQQGKVPGVYRSWEECKAQVHGYSGAVYKSFSTAEEAMRFVTRQEVMGNSVDLMAGSANGDGSSQDLMAGSAGRDASSLDLLGGSIGGNGSREQRKMAGGQSDVKDLGQQTIQSQIGNDREAENSLVAYVDGSYYSATGEFSYGVVILNNGSEYCFNEKMSDPELAAMHNVAGEIKGAEAAMRYAVEHGYPQITIYHDYEGIARWCTGDWKANKSGTQAYKAYYDSISEQLQVRFEKVKGHSGDKYNDMADQLAKQALGI